MALKSSIARPPLGANFSVAARRARFSVRATLALDRNPVFAIPSVATINAVSPNDRTDIYRLSIRERQNQIAVDYFRSIYEAPVFTRLSILAVNATLALKPLRPHLGFATVDQR